MIPKYISSHITFIEATYSEVALENFIDNTPNELQLNNMILVAEKVFEPVRNYLNIPIHVNSFFRCEKLNKLIGGAKNSQHCTGQAIDISINPKMNKKIFDWINENLEFDQIINEDNYTWIHISYALNNCRNMTLKSYKDTKGNTKYLPI